MLIIRPYQLALAPSIALVFATAIAHADSSPNIPLPVQVNNGNVQYNGSGLAIPGWNGTNVDLLAADAWAQCAPILHASSDADHNNAAAQAVLPLDSYMSYLAAQIDAAPCPLATVGTVPPTHPLTDNCQTTECTGIEQWALQRQLPACNVDPSTGEPTVVNFYSNIKDTVPIPNASTFTTLSGNVDGAVTQAQYEVDVAELNLCMGQRLTEYISSADSLLLTASDQLQLVEVTRQRAQLAMVHFAQIGRALANDNQAPSTVTDLTIDQQIFPLFRAWAAKSAGDTTLLQLGQDFAAAVQLHIQTTQDEAQLLARSGSARLARGGDPLSTPELDWGSGSWRQRVSALLFGGNPLGNGGAGSGDVDLTQPGSIQRWLELSQSGGEGSVPWDDIWTQDAWSNFGWPNQIPPISSAEYYATTDASDPRARLLLGLARQADVILLKESSPNATLTFGSTPETLPFRRVDIPTSASQLYLDVEAYLETQDCLRTGGTNCTVSPSASDSSTITAYQQDDLFTRYGITPDHALMLVSLLADAVSRQQLPDLGLATLYNIQTGNVQPSSMTEIEGAAHVLGSHQTLSGAAIQARIPNATGNWYHIDKAFVTSPPRLAERAALYSANAPNWLPRAYDERAGSVGEGFSGLDQTKDMGAIGALAVTRDLLDAATQTATAASSPLLTNYFVLASATIAAIDAAIGTAAVAVRPQTQVQINTPQQISAVSGEQVAWEVEVRQDPNDPFFAGAADGDIQLIAVNPLGLEATAALSSSFVSIAGHNQASYFTGANLIASAAETGASISLPDGGIMRLYDVTLPSVDFGAYASEAFGKYGAAASNVVSFFLTRTVNGQPQYELLARHVSLWLDGSVETIGDLPTATYLPLDGQYFAFGGVLGDLANHAWAARASNWSKPQFDGFGYPTDWVPPTDPSLYGGTTDTSAVQYYLASAQTAATSAGDAVQAAISELLLEDSDNAALASAQKKAAGLDAIAASGLCGAATCDTSTVSFDMFTSGFLPEPSCNSRLCADLSLALVHVPSTVTLAKAVYNVRNDFAPPSFSAYQGGSLQGKLLTEWNALQAVKTTLTTAIAAEAAQDASVAAADADQQLAQDQKAFDCSQTMLENAYEAGWNTSIDVGSFQESPTLNDNGFNEPFVDVNGESFSSSTLFQQLSACSNDQRALPSAEAKDAAALATAYAWLPTAVTSILNSAGALQAAIVDVSQTEHTAALTQQQANLDALLGSDNLTTKFGTSVRYHSFDMWRAEALLESARRYAVAARREIESRYVVDLSALQADEAFVAAPATWADTVYEYDLSPPSALGTTFNANTSANTAGSAIYQNVVTDYVANLSAFVQGFAVTRPTATVSSDEDMFTIVGPDVFDAITYNGQPAQVLDPGSLAWQFWCNNSSSWITNPAASQLPAVDSLTTACGGAAPTIAKVQFTLDPWGRLDGLTASPPFVDRYNVRWVQLAVNLVGTGLLNCAAAVNPSTCFSQSYEDMNLSQTGPSWVSDYSETWWYNNDGIGQIEGGKALAAEQWLDPVANGFDKSYVAAVARQEFADRPVGGSYELDLMFGPELQLNQLQSVQVLTQTAYWVKQ